MVTGQFTNLQKAEFYMSALYIYQNEKGETQFYVKRNPVTAHHDFYFEMPNADKQSKKLNMDEMYTSGKLVCYNLPEVINAVGNNDTIVIVDNEEDCVAMAKIHHTATCAPVGFLWEKKWNNYFKDADVVISFGSWMTADYLKAMIAHFEGTAKSVRIMQVPTGFMNVRSWVTKQKIGAFALGMSFVKAKFWQDVVERVQFLMPVKDLINRLEPTKWLIDEFIETNSLSSIYGPAGSMKSFAAASMAYAIATGSPWFGHLTRKGPVFYLAAEGGQGLRKRFAALEEYHKAGLENNLWLSSGAVDLGNEESCSQIKSLIEKRIDMEIEPPALIIIDTLARSFSGNESSAQEINNMLANVDRFFRNQWGAATLFVAHTPHADPARIRGSSSIICAMDHSFSCEYNREAKHLLFATKKQKDIEMTGNDLYLRLLPVDLTSRSANGEQIESGILVPERNLLQIEIGRNKDYRSVLLRDIVNLVLSQGLTKAQLAERLQMKNGEIDRALRKALELGYLDYARPNYISTKLARVETTK